MLALLAHIAATSLFLGAFALSIYAITITLKGQ